jgi:HK97 family phage major capsid protein
MTTKSGEQPVGSHALEFDRILDEVRQRLDRVPYEKEDSAKVDGLLRLAEFYGPSAARDFRNINLTVAERRAGLDAERHVSLFRRWCRLGLNKMEPEDRELWFKHYSASWASAQVPMTRAQGVGSGAAGGFTVPQGFADEITAAQKKYSAIRRSANIVETNHGRDMPWPVTDDTANVGELLAENAQAAVQDLTFSQVTLKAYKYSSKLVLVSRELLEDAVETFERFLFDRLAERIGRITNTHFTVGNGSTQPAGLVTSASLGKLRTTGQTSSIIYDDLIDLVHAIDASYRESESCVFQMHDSTLKALRKLKDTAAQPILKESENTILGFKVETNPDIAPMSASAKSILFGDFSRFLVREVRPISILRLEERFAESGAVGFLLFVRTDSRLLDASAVKYYQNSAT